MEDLKLESPAVQPELPQNEMNQGDLFSHLKKGSEPVTCLGLTFPNDEARRAHFTALLAEKLKDPAFRAIEGFPIGKDEDILALSDPPYYCACPNPWLGDFIKEWEAAKPKRKGKYEREPFAADVSEGKNDPIYNAHSYHTKVPHKAIMRYILHYTEPGDIVFDGFCGTGMTGVAAQMCGNRKAVESLGYKVDTKGNITDPKAEDPKHVFSHLGARKAVLNDLSPAATFIAYNYNTPIDVEEFEREAKRILAEVEKECGWMYETQHVDKEGKPILGMDGKPMMGKINYVIWSDVFICPHCQKEIVFWDAAIDEDDMELRKNKKCPHCSVALKKSALARAKITRFDGRTGLTLEESKQVPVYIQYKVSGCKGSFAKRLDSFDFDLISKIESKNIESQYPIDELPDGFNTRQPKMSHGFTRVDQFFTRRNLCILSKLWEKFKGNNTGHFLMTSVMLKTASKLHNIGFKNGSINLAGAMPLVLFIPSIIAERNLFNLLEGKIADIEKGLQVGNSKNLISTFSTTETAIQDVYDYIFVDPPFGSNINYSELSYIWETWLGVETNNKDEAIENEVQNKQLRDYQRLITDAFSALYQSLKSNGWMTVEFSNTKAAVWNCIQSSLQDAGFIVANVSSLNKGQGTFKSQTTPTAMREDLVISAYKPDSDFLRRFKDEAATEDGVWDFIRTHLEKLPVSKMKAGSLQVVPERDPRILFDKVVAYYFRNGFPIPISAKEFQEGLRARFTEEDGMFFLPEQHAEYLKQKAKATALVQAELFVSDESSAIAWLRQKLKEKPQKIQTIQPEFMQQIQAWNRYEQQLELRVLLEQNFLCYDGRGPVPNPIHTYLSTQYHELRNLKDDDPALKAKAKDLWYVPNPKDAAEVEKLRERALLKEYEAYKTEKKKIKTPRIEALRLGFQTSYEEHDYAMIVAIAKKLPPDVVETDEKLLRYFDRAQLHLED